jgi:hypothetical protein
MSLKHQELIEAGNEVKASITNPEVLKVFEAEAMDFTLMMKIYKDFPESYEQNRMKGLITSQLYDALVMYVNCMYVDLDSRRLIREKLNEKKVEELADYLADFQIEELKKRGAGDFSIHRSCIRDGIEQDIEMLHNTSSL